jgi:HlyD family secretion protein
MRGFANTNKRIFSIKILNFGITAWLVNFFYVVLHSTIDQNTMSAPKILPSSFTEISVEHILRKYNRTPKIIYLSVLLLLVAGFVSLFFIHVDVSVKAQGILKTPGERIYPKASGSGYVQYVNPILRENAKVTAGDTLIIIGRDVWEEQLQAALLRFDELNDLLADLSKLTDIPYRGASGNYAGNVNFQTSVYNQSYQLFRRRYQNNLQVVASAKRIYDRDKHLFSQQIVTQVDFERVKDDYLQTLAGLETLYKEQLNQWQTEHQRYNTEQLELQSRINQLTIQQQELTVIAPVNGSIQQLHGLKVGNYVTEGLILMEISPEGDIFAECYVSTRDIGLIKIGQKAVLQIDAFNYNQWGMLHAQVSDIAHDVVMPEGGMPFFKVFCTLEKDYLALKNGYKGQLKQGMTFNVRFVVTRRTLFQLLYDKVDNWLNPNIVN